MLASPREGNPHAVAVVVGCVHSSSCCWCLRVRMRLQSGALAALHSHGTPSGMQRSLGSSATTGVPARAASNPHCCCRPRAPFPVLQQFPANSLRPPKPCVVVSGRSTENSSVPNRSEIREVEHQKLHRGPDGQLVPAGLPPASSPGRRQPTLLGRENFLPLLTNSGPALPHVHLIDRRILGSKAKQPWQSSGLAMPLARQELVRLPHLHW